MKRKEAQVTFMKMWRGWFALLVASLCIGNAIDARAQSCTPGLPIQSKIVTTNYLRWVYEGMSSTCPHNHYGSQQFKYNMDFQWTNSYSRVVHGVLSDARFKYTVDPDTNAQTCTDGSGTGTASGDDYYGYGISAWGNEDGTLYLGTNTVGNLGDGTYDWLNPGSNLGIGGALIGIEMTYFLYWGQVEEDLQPSVDTDDTFQYDYSWGVPVNGVSGSGTLQYQIHLDDLVSWSSVESVAIGRLGTLDFSGSWGGNAPASTVLTDHPAGQSRMKAEATKSLFRISGFTAIPGHKYELTWLQTIHSDVDSCASPIPDIPLPMSVDITPPEDGSPITEYVFEIDAPSVDWPVMGQYVYVSNAQLTEVGSGNGGCSTCVTLNSALPPVPGSGKVELNSVNFRVGLGRENDLVNAGWLELHSLYPSAILATPDALALHGVDDASTVIQTTNGTLRQILAPQALADIVVSNDFRYDIKFYANSNGVYLTNGSPYVTWTVQNPYASLTNVNWLRITETRGASSYTNDYVWFDANQGWTLTTGNGLRTESLSNTWNTNATIRTETRQVIDPSDSHVVSQTVSVYQSMSWGEALTSQTTGSGANTWTTSHTYTEQGLKRQVIDSTGSWQIYDYDSNSRITKIYSSFLDQSPTTNSSLCRVTEYTYTPASGSGDDGSFKSEAPRLAVEKLLGSEIGRTYYVILTNETRTIRSQTVGAAWNASDNLVTIEKTYADGDFAWQTKSIQNPDGTVSMYYYSYDASTNKVTTIYSGAPDGSGTNVVDGTITVTVTGNVGQTLAVTNVDIASGIVVDSKTYGNFDDLSRAQRVTFPDGSYQETSYSCCNIDSETDRYGTTTTYGYDALKRKVSSTKNGISQIYNLDADGHILSIIRQGTNSSQMVQLSLLYDTSGFNTGNVDASTNATTFTRSIDSSGHLIVVTTNSDGGVQIKSSYLSGLKYSLTGNAEHGLRYIYGVESDDGVARFYTKEIKLNDDGTDSSEWVKTYQDLLNRKYKTVFPDGGFLKSFYNNAGQLWKQVDPDGVTYLYKYNSKAELEYIGLDADKNDVIDNAGSDYIVRIVRDVIGNYGTSVRRTRYFTWATNGVDSPLLVGAYERSTDGNRAWNTAFGLTNLNINVNIGVGARYITNIYPNGSYSVNFIQNGDLQAVTQFDFNNNQIGAKNYSYDPHNRLTVVGDARIGNSTNFYNNADQVIVRIDPAAISGAMLLTNMYYYNSMGRLWKSVRPDSSSITNEYYYTGELKRNYGSQTYPVEYSYDYAGRIKMIKTWRDFSANIGSAITSWEYDAQRGFLTAKRYADANTGEIGTQGPTYGYTLAGRLNTRTWSRLITATNAYDTVGNLVEISYSDGNTPTVNYSYNRISQLIGVNDASGFRNLFYNQFNQLISKSYTTGILSGIYVTNSYDNLFRVTNVTVASISSGVINNSGYHYDEASRLSEVNDGTNSVSYFYVTNSYLVERMLYKNNGNDRFATTKSYDYANRLRSISAVNDASVTLDYYGYIYNDANQITQLDNVDSTHWSYGYDSINQLTYGHKYWSDNSTVSGQQFDYNYDNVGNLIYSSRNTRTTSYVVNLLNQYGNRNSQGFVDLTGSASSNATVSVNSQRAERKGEYFHAELRFDNSHFPIFATVTNLAVLNNGTNADIIATNTGHVFIPRTPELFAYDSDGNLLSDGRWYYQWDGENRLTSMTSTPTLPVEAVKKIVFSYDSDGCRISKKSYKWDGGIWVLSAETHFLYNERTLLAELDSVNSTTKTYLWGNDLSGVTRGAGGIGGLLSVGIVTNGVHFVISDGNGNVKTLVRADTGDISARYEYDPFGINLRISGALGAENKLRFSSQYQDDESGFLYYGYRYYNPERGRWLTRDPIGEEGGLNLYGFVGNSPTHWVDHLGLNWIPPKGGGGIPTGPFPPIGGVPTGPFPPIGKAPTGPFPPIGGVPTGPFPPIGGIPTGPFPPIGGVPTGTTQPGGGGGPTMPTQPGAGGGPIILDPVNLPSKPGGLPSLPPVNPGNPGNPQIPLPVPTPGAPAQNPSQSPAGSAAGGIDLCAKNFNNAMNKWEYTDAKKECKTKIQANPDSQCCVINFCVHCGCFSGVYAYNKVSVYVTKQSCQEEYQEDKNPDIDHIKQGCPNGDKLTPVYVPAWELYP